MKGLKILMRFLFGAFYASSIWVCVLLEMKDLYKLFIIPPLIMTIIIVIMSIIYLTDNWKDENI